MFFFIFILHLKRNAVWRSLPVIGAAKLNASFHIRFVCFHNYFNHFWFVVRKSINLFSNIGRNLWPNLKRSINFTIDGVRIFIYPWFCKCKILTINQKRKSRFKIWTVFWKLYFGLVFNIKRFSSKLFFEPIGLRNLDFFQYLRIENDIIEFV